LSANFLGSHYFVQGIPMEKAPNSTGRRQLITGAILGIALVACQGSQGDVPVQSQVSPEQVREIRRSLEPMLTRTPEGLTMTSGEGGTQTVDLQGGFQHVFILEKNADGSFSTTCTDSLENATHALAGASSGNLEER
jgi:hypothetical protein